ncbi:cupin domain-containing protein [Gallibacterium anatis]|uniref:cupin domain-containing protein n=1 Tax=Gallibacterium anatis TaxID=750 RepID=UPI002549EE5F|nr:cupin domain-containing protein [Gallibacterium anatis]WIM83978.1 cupin domain-containing protein [Gallibacterium anatis]
MNFLNLNLPCLLVGNQDKELMIQDFEFEKIETDGRLGAMVHWLFKSENSNDSSAAIIHYVPGGIGPKHIHLGYELIYVLDGEMETTSGTVKKNDLVLLKPGSIHGSISKKGCTALIIWQKPVNIMV